MTNTPTTWTDGYGTVHAGPPPAGYWIASDDRWYAPELHPDYTPMAVDASSFDLDTIDSAASSRGAFDADPIASRAPYRGAFDDAAYTDDVAYTDDAAYTDDVAYTDESGRDAVVDDDPRGVDDRDRFSIDPTTVESPVEAGTVAALGSQDASPPLPTDAPAWELSHSWEPPRPEVPQPEAAVLDDDPSPASPNRTAIGVLVGALAILGIAAGIYTLANRGDDDDRVISGETALTVDDQPTTTTSTLDTTPPTVDTTIPSPGAVQPVASSGDLVGIESCSRIDSDTLQISMVNVSDATASYLLTVAYLDADGTRVGDDNVYVSSLRPGERTVEQSYVFSDAGVGCEVIDADRYDRNGLEGLGDISACVIREPNAYGYIEADITATNGGSTDVDYTIEVALVDGDNVRRGYGTAYIEDAAVGAVAPGEVYTTVAYDPALRCDVVAVTRFESTK